MSDLKEFQSAAVARICERLDAKNGSRRFLLADEVGLGKTMVARGVLEELSRRNRGHDGITCVYLCSNLEIAEQNREKLTDTDSSNAATRLTLIAQRAKVIQATRSKKQFQLFLFTPGTSLKLGGATGIKSERRLLLACLYVWRRRKLGANVADWIEFFRCGAGQGSEEARRQWTRSCAPGELRKEVAAIRRTGLYRKMISRWNAAKVSVKHVGEHQPSERPLLAALYRCAEELADSQGDEKLQRQARRNRNTVIGELRKGVAAAALDFLAPDIVLVDEFQRFKDVLELADKEKELAFQLFEGSTKRPRVLILSATPYKAVTFEHEKENHYADFHRTLSFLLGNRSTKAEWLNEVNSLLTEFKDKLTGDELELPALINLKSRLEARLKEVMCRTERNRYVLDEHKGIEDRPDLYRNDRLPIATPESLSEFVYLRSFLKKHDTEERPLPSIMDFWKSCSSVITFMDSGYILIRNLKRAKVRIDSTLLRRESDFDRLPPTNLKMQTLVSRLRESCRLEQTGLPRWPFLWTRPAYLYHKDEFFGDRDPTKFLVFSRWRFVPKAISFVVSGEFESTGRRGRGRKQPLELNSESLKVCFPMVVLADLVEPAVWAANEMRRSKGSKPSPAALRNHVRKRLQDQLKAAGIPIVKKGPRKSYWPALFALEQWHLRNLAKTRGKSDHKASLDLYTVLEEAISAEGSHSSDSVQADEFLNAIEPWAAESSQKLVFPKEMLTDAVTMALASPAVCLMRAVRSLFGAETDFAPVARICFRDLRTYFNKGYVQEIIRRHSRSGRYADQVLRYCFDAHFQSVIDEYVYLLRRVLQRSDVEKLIQHVGRVFATAAGAPNINVPTARSGRIKEKRSQRPVNFAMAFGEESPPEDTAESRASRKTAVRESFNSPFWPFVLATTSIGQEGLDFHLYCRDVMHWNLPSNPVDLEQREGRINRFDGLVVRRNVIKDYPLAEIPLGVERSNLWDRVFKHVEANPHGNQHFKHGLFPHWVFEPTRGEPMRIRRHLAIFEGSRDRKHYERLKKYLYYYRLAFGQARQQDLLDKIVGRPDEPKLRAELQSCMVNLSPFPDDYSWKQAQRDAIELVKHPDKIRELVASTKALSAERSIELREVDTDLEALWQVAERIVATGSTEVPEDVGSVAALIYLLNPYDEHFDSMHGVGLRDDVAIVQKAVEARRRPSKLTFN
jgi:uncharacterized membrane protein YkvA (DUF1232 family)